MRPPEVLVFRSVSVERLSAVLTVCRRQWPDGRLCVLTSANRAGEVAGEAEVAEVVSLPTGFADLAGRDGRGLEGRRFAALVIPVAAQSVFGYGNLLALARHLASDGVYVAYMASNLAQWTKPGLWAAATLESACLAAARLPARLLAQNWVRPGSAGAARSHR